jgi:hypothetical protein
MKDIFSVSQHGLRATDSNSLLRMLDHANKVLADSVLLQERARATKAVQRLARELQKREETRSAEHSP